MKNTLAFCGLDCTTCPAFIAKATNNDALRQETAQNWAKLGYHVRPEEINCDGCHSDGILLPTCQNCTVRNCGRENSLNSCAECKDYPCQDLQRLWSTLHAPQAKIRLDSLKKKIKN